MKKQCYIKKKILCLSITFFTLQEEMVELIDILCFKKMQNTDSFAQAANWDCNKEMREQHKHKVLSHVVRLSFCRGTILVIKVDIDSYGKEIKYLDILQKKMRGNQPFLPLAHHFMLRVFLVFSLVALGVARNFKSEPVWHPPASSPSPQSKRLSHAVFIFSFIVS